MQQCCRGPLLSDFMPEIFISNKLKTLKVILEIFQRDRQKSRAGSRPGPVAQSINFPVVRIGRQLMAVRYENGTRNLISHPGPVGIPVGSC